MDTVGKKVVELRIEDVLPNRFQPRIKFNEEAINELSKSIKEHGVIQPIVVRPIGDKYEIIAGERRYKASCMAELKTIPAIITDLNDKDSAEVALIENVQREDLTPIEEAISYKKILDMGYITQEALATKLGKTQSTVANKLRLLNLDDEVQEALLNEQISERHARSLLKLTDKEQQKQLLTKIINERLTVRKTDDEINKLLNGTTINENNSTPVFTVNETPKETEPFKFINQPEENNNEVESSEHKFINIPDQTEDPINIPLKLDEPEAFKAINSLIDGTYTENNEQNIINQPIENDKSEQEMPKFINKTMEEPDTPRFINQPIENNESEPSEPRFINTPADEPDTKQTEEETTEDENQEQEVLKPTKFFNILEDDEKPKEEEKQEEQKEPVFDFDNMFNNPTITPIEQNATDNNALLEELNEIESSIKNSNVEELEEEPEDQPVLTPNNNQEESSNPLKEEPNTIVPENKVDEDTEFIDGFEEELEEEPEEKTTINEPILTPTINMSEIKDAIQHVRDCTNEIEKSGFKIDTEELDLENEYQIIIKIEK